MGEEAEGRPHSAEFFNEHRDFWWNADYLQLLGRRFGLDRCRSALDVGCGVGHWGRLLLPLLADDARLTGVDPEPRWVHQAHETAVQAGIGNRCDYRLGAAERLPFTDESFDLVTCQTVLIHVANIADAVREMTRVLAPGGILLATEPNNLAGALVRDSITADQSIETVMERVEFALICERGKASLGEGDSSAGDLLPAALSSSGLVDIEAFLNDKTFSLISPYAATDQQALRDAVLRDADENRWPIPEHDARRWFVAGGGSEPDFAARWRRRLHETREEAEYLRSERYTSAGGGIQYVVAGRKPRARSV